jgi:anaerobic magnesium-protoporphyrin IX monomethyl ester cyclase
VKVLLSTPPGKTTELWPPLGLLYIAANVKKHQAAEVEVLDAFCLNMSHGDLVAKVVEKRPDLFGMNCSTHTFLDAMMVFEELSKRLPDTILVLGGYHATFAAERILRAYPHIDYIVKGEAEEAFVELLSALKAGKEPVHVQGISYLKEGRHHSNQIAIVKDLDSLPPIDRDMLRGVEYGYSLQGIPLTFGKFTTISTSRGCPHDCSYCSCATFSLRKWRYRSAENVVAEMKELSRAGYKNVVLVDDNFTQKADRVKQICEGIRREGIRMRFYCEGRVNNASPELMRTMKKAGFDVMYFGAESGCQKVLDYFNKNIRPEQTVQAVEAAKQANMIVVTSFILGAPGETMEDKQQTIGFIHSLRPHAVQINILDYLVGTPLWEELDKSGRLQPDAWRTNHRVYEYDSSFDRATLEALVNQGYSTYIDAWKTKEGVREFLRLLVRNHTARRIVFSNIFNPKARAVITGGMKVFDEGS